SHLAEDLSGTKNPLYVLRDELHASRTAVFVLVRGNVNEHGIRYPGEVLADVLKEAVRTAGIYRPDSFGQPVAREAIAQYYAHAAITPQQILITPGTSLSYWYCFKLLAERGDEILSPQPSYPLFDYIAKLSGVEMTH